MMKHTSEYFAIFQFIRKHSVHKLSKRKEKRKKHRKLDFFWIRMNICLKIIDLLRTTKQEFW